MKSSSNIISFNSYLKNKTRVTENDIYNTCFDKWLKIPRACDSSKTIVNEAIWFIATIEFQFLKHSDEVIFNSELLEKKCIQGPQQRSRFLKQIANLYNIKYYPAYNYKGKKYRCVSPARVLRTA